MRTITKQLTTFCLIFIFLLFRAVPIQAIETPTAPAPPESPTIESSASTPTPPSAPTLEELVNNEQSEESQETQATSEVENSLNLEGNGTGIETGDATTSETLTTTGNNNLNETSNQSGIQATNTNNGANSENQASIETQNNSLTVQDNKAEADNELELETNTGDNAASYNTGEDSSIITGDANTTGTIITSLNTNVDAVSVSEFNINDNQTKDLILDFDANCISGCSSGTISAQNSDNGADSENNVLINNLSEDATFQTNNADVDNSLILSSDSGNNTANYNTNGDSIIQTGDANTSGNVLTFANNNIAGKIIFGVVNIFGNLVGDIILPENLLTCTDCQQITAANSNNGADSDNNTVVATSDTEEVFQTNLADIENNFTVTAATGDNQTSYNTNGNSSTSTGDADAVVQAINVANSNIEGDNMWLVIVNKAGEWVGQILGAPEGGNFAGSTGTEFTVNSNGEITATNSGNGAGSQNNTTVSQNNTSTTVQENIAKIINNLILSSNTGGNQASYNTGGDSTIQTGDAKAIANLVNFVNNNISGNGKLIVTVVNVFGSWVGDFVTPGSKKTATANTQNEESTTQSASPQPLSNNESGSPQTTSSSNNGQTTITNQTTSNPSETSSPLPLQNLISFISAQNNNPEEGVTLVAGAKTENNPSNILTEGAKEMKKKANINLAWLLLLLPTAPLLYLAKRKL